jgi:hypothetical protein
MNYVRGITGEEDLKKLDLFLSDDFAVLVGRRSITCQPNVTLIMHALEV